MERGIDGVQRGKSLRGGRPSLGASVDGLMQDHGWIPIALGTVAILAMLGGRKKSAVAFAVTAFAGLAAADALRGVQLDRGKAHGKGRSGASGGKPEVERSITIGKTADELRHCWLDPRTLPQIMAGFATVRTADDGRTHWTVKGPLSRTYEWDSETVNRPGEDIGWRSLSNAAISNEGWVRFHPASADRGTVVTLHFRFVPPGGALGASVLELFGTTPLDLVADGVLRRFKNLVETGEIPTTARQPAARADTR